LPAYWHRWSERFGFYPTDFQLKNTLWVHAVSVGEVQAALPLIEALLKRFHQYPLLVTTMTPTGSQRVQELFSHRVAHVYLPYDLPSAMTRLLNRIHPRLLILMETELWPNLLFCCHQRKVPVILVNARLSAPSARGYQRLGRFISETINYLTLIATQTEADAQRFASLGVPSEKLQVTGNIKFDLQLPEKLAEHAKRLRQQWGIDRPVWIAASTHEGEEEIVLEALARVKQVYKDLFLILVPRHPERFNPVAKLCEHYGYMIARRGRGQISTLMTDIYLGDTLGELLLLYATADVAFIGGTLVPIGGHNLVEPMALGLPLIIGTHTFECEEISQQLITMGIAQQVQNVDELTEALMMYLSDTSRCHQISEQARLFIQQNRGALARLLNLIEWIHRIMK
jgi:3-deoxy-D-manno-octulosonic-acid transferase